MRMTGVQFLLLALAAGYINYVLVYSVVFEFGRDFVTRLTMVNFLPIQLVARKLEKMLKCPFCTGFWVSVAIQVVFKFDFFGHGKLGVALIVPAIAVVSAFISLVSGMATYRLVGREKLDA